MTDKEKFRKEVKRLKSQLLRGACSSQIAMETRCKEEAYNEVLSVLDTMQEEPVKRTPADIEAAMQEVEDKSRFFTEVYKGEDSDTILAQMRGEEPVSEELEEAAKNHAVERYRATRDIVLAEKCKWSFKAGAEWQKTKDESTTEDLGEYINELSKQFPEVSFAKLSRIAVRVAKWQKQKDDREIKMVRELLADFDKHCDEYHEAGFKHGQEALMKDAVEAVCDVTIHAKGDEVQYSVLYPVGKRPFHKGDKVKVIVIKED